MTREERALHEVVEKLKTAWNSGDSMAWASLFAEDADFIHILGGQFNGRTEIERGHRMIFDTIYKGSRDKFSVEEGPAAEPDVAILFVRAHHKWYLNGDKKQIDER